MQEFLFETYPLRNNTMYKVVGGTVRRLEIPNCFEGYFSVKNRICAILWKGIVYVFPVYEKALLTVKSIFFEANFEVPFSNGDIPSSHLRWNRLLEIQSRENAIRYTEQCVAYVKKHFLGRPLAAEDFAQCIKLPVSNFLVQDALGKVSLSRPISNFKFTEIAVHNLCTYYYCNGITVFIYLDGNIYLTPSKVVRAHLEQSGYRLVPMDVPLSNGEIPDDNTLARQWKNLLAAQLF